MEPTTNISQMRPVTKEFNLKDYLTFKLMITLPLMQIWYVVIAVLITLAGLATMFSRSSYGSIIPSGFWAGLGIIIFGNISWRLLCELIIVLFRINATLNKIDNNTNR